MPNLDKALADMAAKLGTKAEALWPVLVANERLEWLMCAAIAVLVILAGSVLLWLIVRENIDDDWTPGAVIVLALGLIVAFACVIIHLIGLSRWWVFSAPFDTHPLSVSRDQWPATPSPSDEDTQKGVEFLCGLIEKRSDGPAFS